MKINQNGFREYDARWLFEKDIDLEGITDLGKGLGTQIINHTKKTNPRVIVGQDYRSYSEKIKKALTEGLVSTGCNVEDVGLALSPMVYFAQFNLNSDAIAMVTASHNENGWTGVKMGIKKGLTHAPEEMSELKDKIVTEIKKIYDPEIPVNIFELGLIYKIEINDGKKVNIEMTLTSPNCPVAESLPKMVKDNVLKIDEVSDVDLKLVWNPPWTKDMMSEAAKLELNL